MASSIEVLVYLGSDTGITMFDLDQHLTAEIPGAEHQHLDCIAGGDYNPGHLRGSGQAGTLRVYGGLIRRGRPDWVLDHLTAAPWGYKQAVVTIHDEHHREPHVWLVDKTGARELHVPEMVL